MHSLPNKTKPELYKIFSSSLTSILDRIKSHISKKNQYYTEIINILPSFHSSIKDAHSSPEWSSDHFFPIICKSLDIENYKISDSWLTNIKPWIVNDLWIGSTRATGTTNVIDLVVKTWADLIKIKDDDMWLTTSDVLNDIVLNDRIELSEWSLEVISGFYLDLIQKVKKEIHFIVLKERLFNLTHKMFHFIKLKFAEYSMSLDNQNGDNIILSFNTLYKAQAFDTIWYTGDDNVKRLNNKQQWERVLNRWGKEMVDTICINAERRRDEKTDRTGVVTWIPKSDKDFSSPCYRRWSHVNIANELGVTAGYFGWCSICRKKANFYSKDYKAPLCSMTCKISLERDETLLNKYFHFEQLLKHRVFTSVVSFSRLICRYIKTNSTAINIKLILLDIINTIVGKYGDWLFNRKDFIQWVQEDLTEGLFQNCVNEDQHWFELSVMLFFNLWDKFREHLKAQISIFNESVFLKILASENSPYTQKKIVIDYFAKQDLLYFFELYINYDCDMEEKFWVNRIVTAWGKIAQGIWTKKENVYNVYSEEQCFELRKASWTKLTSWIQSIYEICRKKYARSKGFLNEHRGSFNAQTTQSNGDKNSVLDTPSVDDSDRWDESDSIINETPLKKDAWDINLKRKRDYQKAADKFNICIKTGIAFLKQNGYVCGKTPCDEAKDITAFIKSTPGWSKEKIGELLGDNSEVNWLVLQFFTGSFEFKDLHIIQALRNFWSTFQLPGEGQKIDRILEKFASQYYQNNKTIYANADCAYYLAFAIIILQTELHNPNVVNKMSFESFSKILAGKNGNKNWEKEYLLDIYNQISQTPISLPEWDEAKEKWMNLPTEDNYKKWTKRILSECSQKLRMSKDKIYVKITDISAYLSPFIENIWSPFLAMFSVIIEDKDDSSLYLQCISGISNWIKILGWLDFNFEKVGFISSLCSWTNLSESKWITDKNIICIKELLVLANSDCRYFKTSWPEILKIINKIYYYHFLASSSKTDQETLLAKIRRASTNTRPNATTTTTADDQIGIERKNIEILAKHISSNEYEKWFSNSVNFADEDWHDFVCALCSHAETQFDMNTPTKIFYLQKIIEIADGNLHRIQFIWDKIWTRISQFLVHVSLSQNEVNSINAVDSLRQWAMKFLKKEESRDYHFQNDFLKPFLTIWERSENFSTKEYVLYCINNWVQNEGKSIKSGWSIILQVYSTVMHTAGSADSLNEPLKKVKNDMKTQTLQVLLNVANKNFTDIQEVFADYAGCLKWFGGFSPEKVLHALDSIIAKVRDNEHFQILLSCYIDIILDERENIRLTALNKMFLSINQGWDSENTRHLKSCDLFWSYLFKRIVLPLITAVEKTGDKETLENLLIKASALFVKYFDMNSFLWPPFLASLTNTIWFSYDDDVCTSCFECLKYLLGTNWMSNSSFVHCFIEMNATWLARTIQNKYPDWAISNPDDAAFRQAFSDINNETVIKGFIQHNILEIIEILTKKHLDKTTNPVDLKLLVESLEKSMNDFYWYNFNIELRIEWSKAMNWCEIFGLFKQQQASTRWLYSILKHWYEASADAPEKRYAVDKIISVSKRVLLWFVEKNNLLIICNDEDFRKKEYERLISNFIDSAASTVFPSWMNIEFYKFPGYKNDILKSLLDLILCKSVNLRKKIKEILNVVYAYSNQ